MHNYLAIVRLQLRNMLRRNRDASGSKKWIAAVIGFAVLYLIIAASLVSLVLLLGNVFAVYQLQSELITLILLCAMAVVLVFGIVTVLTCLYFSKDTEFFLGLPVRSSTVFAAKITVVYLVELCITALMLLPCLIAAGIIMQLPVVFYVLLPLAVILTPMIPLLLAAIVAIPIMYLVSFLKNKGALGSILVIVLFGAFFVCYYIGISRMQNIDPAQIDLSGIQHIFQNISNTVYPMYALARAMTLHPTFGLDVGASFAVNLGICILSIAAVGAIALFISAAVYRRGAAIQLEGAKRNKTTTGEYRSSGAVKALMKKEWREIIRTPSFAMNCLLGVVMCPIIVGFIGFSSDITKIAAQAAEQGEPIAESTLQFISMMIRFLMLFIIMFMSVGTNAAPSTVISREGDKFAYCKLMPVPHKVQLRAKSYLYFLFGALASLFGAAAMAIVNFDLVFLLCSVVFLLIFQYAGVHFGMIIDLLHPKLKWTTPNEVLKHNSNVMLTIFVVMFAALVFAGIGAGVYALTYFSLGTVAAVAVSWVTLFVLVIVAAIACHAVLYAICDKRLEAVEG